MCVGKIFRKKYSNNYVWGKRLSSTWHTDKNKESFPVHLQVKSAAQVQYLLNQVTERHSLSARETQWEVRCHCVSVIWDNGITVWMNTIDDQRNDSTNSSLGDQRVLKEYRWFKVTWISETSPSPPPPWALTHKSWDQEFLCPTCIQLHWKIKSPPFMLLLPNASCNFLGLLNFVSLPPFSRR